MGKFECVCYWIEYIDVEAEDEEEAVEKAEDEASNEMWPDLDYCECEEVIE